MVLGMDTWKRKRKLIFSLLIVIILLFFVIIITPDFVWWRNQDRRNMIREQIVILNSITVLYLNASFILHDYQNITNIVQLRAFLRDKNKMKEWRVKYNFKDDNTDDLDVLETQYGASNIFFNSNMKLWDLDSEIGSEIDPNDIALMLHLKDKYFVRHFREGGGKVLKTNEFLLTGRNALYLKNE